MNPSETPNRGGQQRKLRNFLIDRRFQLKWTAIVVLVNIGICVILAVPLYYTAASASDQLLALKSGEPRITTQAMDLFVRKNHEDKRTVILALGLFLGALFVTNTIAWIILTHKIAGPVYKLRRILRGIDDFHLKIDAHIRRGDELKDVVFDFNEMILRLAECRKEDAELLRRAAEKLRASTTPEERNDMLKAIENLASRYKRSVE